MPAGLVDRGGFRKSSGSLAVTQIFALLARERLGCGSSLKRADTQLFVIGNAATLVADACLKGELCSWLDSTRFW
jgi:hypothetical protein